LITAAFFAAAEVVVPARPRASTALHIHPTIT
jgi:hypothetical protein